MLTITAALVAAGSPNCTARWRRTRASQSAEFVTTFGIADSASSANRSAPVSAYVFPNTDRIRVEPMATTTAPGRMSVIALRSIPRP